MSIDILIEIVITLISMQSSLEFHRFNSFYFSKIIALNHIFHYINPTSHYVKSS